MLLRTLMMLSCLLFVGYFNIFFVKGFLATSPKSTRTRTRPRPGPPRLFQPSLTGAKKKNDEEGEDEDDRKGRIARFFSNNNQKKEEVNNSVEDKQGEEGGMFRFITKRFPGDKEKGEKSSAPQVPSNNEVAIRAALARQLKGTSKESETLKDENLDIPTLTEAWESLGNKMLVARDTISNIGSETEKQRLKEIRDAQEARRKDKLEEFQRKREEETAKIKTKKLAEKLIKEQEEREAKEQRERKRSKQQESRNTPTGGKSGGKPLSVGQSVGQKLFKRLLPPKEEWIPVFPKTRIMPGMIVPITAGGLDLLVVASNDGTKLYAIANSCSHLGTPLDTGKLIVRPANPGSKFGSAPAVQGDNANELCIECPLHRTQFALGTGEVRGDWCPYPPVIGKVMGTVKEKSSIAVFDIRTRGKNVEVRINSILPKD